MDWEHQLIKCYDWLPFIQTIPLALTLSISQSIQSTITQYIYWIVNLRSTLHLTKMKVLVLLLCYILSHSIYLWIFNARMHSWCFLTFERVLIHDIKLEHVSFIISLFACYHAISIVGVFFRDSQQINFSIWLILSTNEYATNWRSRLHGGDL